MVYLLYLLILLPIYILLSYICHEFPWWRSGKELACNAGDAGYVGSIPESGSAPGEGNSNPLQYSCLGKSMDRAA